MFLKIESSEIYIIHKTRAHKRILYEFYLNSFKNKIQDSQKLAFPISISLSNQNLEVLAEIKNDLFELGFSFDIKSNNQIEFNGLPINFNNEAIQKSIEELIEEYKNFDSIENNTKKKLALTMSELMKLDINHILSDNEMQKINEELMKCEHPNFSPKGKPVIIHMDIIK